MMGLSETVRGTNFDVCTAAWNSLVHSNFKVAVNSRGSVFWNCTDMVKFFQDEPTV